MRKPGTIENRAKKLPRLDCFRTDRVSRKLDVKGSLYQSCEQCVQQTLLGMTRLGLPGLLTFFQPSSTDTTPGDGINDLVQKVAIFGWTALEYKT